MTVGDYFDHHPAQPRPAPATPDGAAEHRPPPFKPCPRCAGQMRSWTSPGYLPRMRCETCLTWYIWEHGDTLAMWAFWAKGIAGMQAVWAIEAAGRAPAPKRVADLRSLIVDVLKLGHSPSIDRDATPEENAEAIIDCMRREGFLPLLGSKP